MTLGFRQTAAPNLESARSARPKGASKPGTKALVYPEACLGERHERSPSRHAEAGDKEHDMCAKLFKARGCGTRASADGCHKLPWLRLGRVESNR
jgi:hypothetical protein